MQSRTKFLAEIFRKNNPFYAKVIVINHRSKFSSSFFRYNVDDKLVSFRCAYVT